MSGIQDSPLPMNQLGVAMIQDLGSVYRNHSSHEKDDLLTVWESMYEKGLHRKVSSQCYYTPEEIEEARRKEEAEKAQELEKSELQAAEKAKIGDNQVERSNSHGSDESDEKRAETDPEEVEWKRDFASIHLDRAANSSRAHWHTDEGRRYRKRTYSNSSTGEPHELVH